MALTVLVAGADARSAARVGHLVFDPRASVRTLARNNAQRSLGSVRVSVMEIAHMAMRVHKSIMAVNM